jgi:hypothetical protein
VFSNTDFVTPGNATAFEVTASINYDTALGFEATTAGGGAYVVIRPISESNNTIYVTTPTTSGRNAALLLGFPATVIDTIRLYKNNIPLSEDGSTASVFTQAQTLWSNTISTGDTLILSIDGTAPITFTITNADFINTGLYTSVSSTNSLASWVEVFNNVLTGVTASIVGQQIELTSNLDVNNRAEISIDSSSTLVSKGMFSTIEGLSSTGHASDFTLDRNTAQFQLVTPLVAGDKLAAGSAQTEATIQSTPITAGSLTLSTEGYIWLLIDTPGTIIPTGVISSSLLTVSTPSSNVVRYTSNVVSAFVNVNVGDYVIIWSAELPASDQLEGRVHALTSTTLDILVTPTEWAAVTPVTSVDFNQGFVVLRSALAPQKFNIPAGNSSLDAIALQLQMQSRNLTVSIFQEEAIVIATTTMDSTGSLLLVTADSQGQLLQIAAGTSGISETSLFAYYDSQDYTGDLPLFIHSTFASGTSANPPDSAITSLNTTVALSTTDQNNLLVMLQPYGTIGDAQAFGETVQETLVTGGGTTIGITGVISNPITGDVVPDPYLRRVRAADRFYLASPLNFGPKDTAVVIVDENVVSETFTIPFFRNSLTNTTYAVNTYSYNAYDSGTGPTTPFTTNFVDFDFTNFKALMQAKKVLKPTPSQTAILYRATQWGHSGEQVTVGYAYPSTPNSSIGSAVLVGTTVAITITLKSGGISTNSIDSSTEWNVTITANTPTAGIDQVTFTWNGTGTNPALTLSGGEYVTITTATGFNIANTGTFRVSTAVGFAPTATSFTVQMPHGVAFAQSGVLTLVNNGITLYQPSATTAAQIATYVNANLSQYISATLVNDGGSSGAGVIVLSTYEDSGFTYSYVQLLDGINWIASSNLTGSPQFTLKNALSYPADGPGNAWYAFNNGETVVLVPTTVDQVDRLASILAVSGFTTDGNFELVDRQSRLQIATNTLGSIGAIQVIGGTANEYSFPLLDSALNINNTYVETFANQVASQGVNSDQWFRLQASNAQAKNTGFSSNTNVSVAENTPTSTESVVTLLGRTLTQRNFGKPRNNVRSQGDTFRVEKQGSLVCVSWNGIGSNPMFVQSSLNFNASGGGTMNVTPVASTSDVQFIILTGTANFTTLSIGDLVTVSGLSVAANNGTFFVTGISNNGTTIQVTNPLAQSQSGASYTSSTFAASSGVSEGDTVIFTAPFSILNQGRFRVIRQYNNSIWIENPNVIEEEVTLPYNPASLGFDATTVFSVNASNNSFFLEWTGTGTEPTLGNASVGDILTVGTDFNAANQGSFMVLDSSPKLQQITQLILPAGGQFTASAPAQYFETYDAGNAHQYYVWYNVNGTNSDPAPGGFTGIQVAILSGDTAVSVASKTALAITGVAGAFITAVASGNTVTLTTVGYAPTNATVNVNVPAPFSITTTQFGTRTYLEAINPAAVTQATVSVVSGVLQDHIPQMQFWEYDASVPGDLFVVNGSTLGPFNAGSFAIIKVLNRDSAIIDGALASIADISLNNNISGVNVTEGVPYSGYKHVFLVSSQPGAPTQNIIVFDTNAQSQKINSSANVEATSLGKLNFNTALLNGLDSYRYNTGLIAEANRIIYGDTRDPITYPGVGAAGADIFVQEPLTLRVKVSVDIRLQTGAPFAYVSQQVSSNISYLINSNPVGQSIAISSIINAAMSVPGVISVAVNSPLYNATHDLIQVAQNEKALVLDPTTDIIIDQIGA